MNSMMFFSLFFLFTSFTLGGFGLYALNNFFTVLLDWGFFLFGGGEFFYSLLVDGYGLLFSACVFLISGSVFMFSCGYMGAEGSQKRFCLLVCLFVVSMLFLIFSGNLIGVMLGWDGLGLTSFLLVVYYQNPYSVGAGMITALTNRLGDVGLILCLGLLVDFGYWGLFISDGSLGLVISFLFIGAMTKSAQYPFSSWLPMAMAAPTPVSALVHSSTLVTAGVFLLIRFNGLIALGGHGFSLVLIFSSCLTMVVAGLAASVETDLKKIIAYSTLSQLGVMVLSLGLGNSLLALFHLLSHALFKALMFICAGTLIHYHGHSQDIRLMGGLSEVFPVTQLGLTVSSLALCGFPFMSGFYSKDPIYEVVSTGEFGYFSVFFMVLGLFLTSCYTLRSIGFSQVGEKNLTSLNCFGNKTFYFSFPVLVLGVGAVLWGSALNWVLLPNIVLAPLGLCEGVLPLLLFFLVLLLGVFFFKGVIFISVLRGDGGFYTAVDGFMGLFFLSSVSSQFVIFPAVKFSGALISVVDCGWTERYTGQLFKWWVGEKWPKAFQVLTRNYVPMFFLTGFVLFFYLFAK